MRHIGVVNECIELVAGCMGVLVTEVITIPGGNTNSSVLVFDVALVLV